MYRFFVKLAFAICNSWDTIKRKNVKIGVNVVFRNNGTSIPNVRFREKYKKLEENRNLAFTIYDL